MTDSARYVKIVEWSEQDQAFLGQCPGIIGPCCHGLDDLEVNRELCVIVDEWLAALHQSGKPLPKATAGMNVSRLMLA